jgi:hypothetical protein
MSRYRTAACPNGKIFLKGRLASNGRELPRFLGDFVHEDAFATGLQTELPRI